jgi:hypothetical protein
MIVNLAIEYDPNCAVFVADGLMSGREVNDAKAPYSQPDTTVRVNSLIIRTAMNHGLAHFPKMPRIDMPGPPELQYTGDSTHLI